jgi:hypothetical protein
VNFSRYGGNDGRLRVAVSHDLDLDITSTTASRQADTAYLMTVTYDASSGEYILYIDGQQETTITAQ